MRSSCNNNRRQVAVLYHMHRQVKGTAMQREVRPNEQFVHNRPRSLEGGETNLQKNASRGEVRDRRQRDWRVPPRQDPFKCSYCGASHTFRAFATLYAEGSSLSKHRKGLILKTGWSETRRQSVLAERCAPPRKKRVVWRSVALAIVAATMYGWRSIPSLPLLGSGPQAVVAVTVILAAFYLLDGVRWNRFSYPRRMATWESSYFCKRCSRVTILQLVTS